jgi:hypothetical protein
MKNNLLLCFLALGCAVSSTGWAQNPVPNAGFENWTAGEPDDWFTSNISGLAVGVTQTTPAYSGSLAAKGEVIALPTTALPPLLSSTDMSGTGFPVSQLYNAVNFYYKYTHAGSAYFFMAASVLDASQVGVAGAYFATSATANSYTLASVPFINFGSNPAECIIQFTIADSVSAVPAQGNTFVVDEVSLTGTVGIDEAATPAHRIEKVNPNPAADLVTVYYETISAGDLHFDVVDLHGRQVTAFPVPMEIPGRHKMDFDVSRLPAGLYFLRMRSVDGLSTIPLSVVR